MSINRFTLQKAALALSLMIVINLFVYIGVINTFFPEPQFDQFCEKAEKQVYEEENTCVAAGGEWIKGYEDIDKGRYSPRPVLLEEDRKFQPYCDAYATCREEHQESNREYKRNIFIVSVVLGTVAVIAGIFFIDVSAITTGLLLAGLLLYFIGTVRFWSDMDEYLRLIVLTIVLIALFYVGFKKLNDRKAIKKND